LRNEQIHAVTALVLDLNGCLPAIEVLEAHSLPQVRIPNHDVFQIVWPN